MLIIFEVVWANIVGIIRNTLIIQISNIFGGSYLTFYVSRKDYGCHHVKIHYSG
jgi:hypothetical protein